MALAGSESVQLQPEVNTMTVDQNVKFASCKLKPTRWIVTEGSHVVGALAVQIWEFANSFFDEAEYLCRYVETRPIEKNAGGRSDNLRVAGVNLLSSNLCTYGRVISL